MARRQNDDSFLNEELEAAFDFGGDFDTNVISTDEFDETEATVEQEQEEFPGQLAVDVFETEDKLFVKARTAGVNKQDLDVSLSDNILTISGTLSSGDQEGIVKRYEQECFWGEFSRTLSLPVPIKEDEVEAILKDGVLTISFSKIRQEPARRIQVL